MKIFTIFLIIFSVIFFAVVFTSYSGKHFLLGEEKQINSDQADYVPFEPEDKKPYQED